jgi:hypothetical protein
MTSAQQEELSRSLESWVAQHPRPHSPTISYWGRDYTPEEILDEVRNGTLFGQELGDFLFRKAGELETTVEAIINQAIENNHRWQNG